jgi:NTP pyrophosphatase (non-canonical NTP hydrolase)
MMISVDDEKRFEELHKKRCGFNGEFEKSICLGLVTYYCPICKSQYYIEDGCFFGEVVTAPTAEIEQDSPELGVIQEIRPEILEFALAIEQAMKENDEEKGDSGKTINRYGLILKLSEEVGEVNNVLNEEVFAESGFPDILKRLQAKLADLGAVAGMLWYRTKEEIQ